MPDLVDQCQRAIDHAAGVIAKIGPNQLSIPTPCTEYNVRSLLNHMIGGMTMMTLALDDRPMTYDPSVDLVGENPLASYRTAGERVITAFRQPGALDRTLKLRFGDFPATAGLALVLGDQLVHSWDLAKATGQDPTLPSDLAESTLAMTRQRFASDHARAAGGPFGPEVPCPDNAPITDRLVAFLGRQP